MSVPIDIPALRKLLAEATERPWLHQGDEVYRMQKGYEVAVVDLCMEEDAALVAAAVNALPALLDGYEGLQAKVATYQALDWDEGAPQARVIKLETEVEYLKLALSRWQVHHLDVCPQCGGPADNGFDRCLPPDPYWCTHCQELPEDEPLNTTEPMNE